jgi:hypothetical protein
MQDAAMLDRPVLSTVRTRQGGLVSAGVLFVFLCAWHWRVTGALSLSAGATLALLVGAYLAYGQLFEVWTARLFRNTVGLPFQFLCGYFFFNTLLFILALASPFGMGINLAILGVLGAAGVLALRKRAVHPDAKAESASAHGDTWATWAAIVVAGLGATIWCGDIQAPLQVQDGKTVFKVWPDVFIHVREISVFAQAHGLSTIHDIKLAGGPPPLYHFASYLSAAAVHALGGASAMQVYASFQLPFGILLTGLAAFCLTGSFMGRWAGVAAAAAVVLLPDAFQQGFGNRYLSYYFLSQVNLGMLYGIACAALAWLFMLDGCRRGKLGTVMLAYGFLAICLFYKAHIFVANSYLLLMFPILFYTPLRRSWRVVIGIAATLLFVGVVAYSQTNPRVPVMRLDGSGISGYLVQLLHDYDPGMLKRFFTRIFLREHYPKPVQLLVALVMLALSTFGVWLFVLPAAAAAARKRVALPLLCFPFLVGANYLIMAAGLAADSRGVGTADELMNRPLVWAYFVAAAWTTGLLVTIWNGSGLLRDLSSRRLAGAALLVAAIGAALYHAPNLQTFPARMSHVNFFVSNSVPKCLFDSAAFIRTHGAPADVIQDSAGDPRFVLTALAERQLYVGAIGFGGSNAQQLARRDDVLGFMRSTDAAQPDRFATARGIAWFLAYPDAVLGWPHDAARTPAFACGGFRLYRFPDARQAVSNT